ncbi:MAG TPA: hypothetical protein VIM21_11760 [Gemmatimonadaceae bacterium]
MIAKMIYGKQIENSKALMRIGFLFLGLGLAWPKFLPLTGNLDQDAIDGIRGLLLGLGIGLALWSAMLTGRQRRARGM